MNDRMYELINECFIGTKDGELSELNTVKNIEKFAELIMQECMSACATDKLGKTASAEELIKDHFGVE